MAANDEVDLQKLEYYRDYKLGKNQIPFSEFLLRGDVAAKIDSGEYPSLEVLAKLQREKGQDPRNPRAERVEPFPPRRQKDDIFDLEKFKAKDEYAKRVLPNPNETDEAFSQRLFAMSRSNLDKVRAAFVFISTANVGSLPEGKNESELYKRIRLMRSDKGDPQSEVFDSLLKLADVPYKRITGLKKGTEFQKGKKIKSSGTWFACYVEGEWRFVDAMWGSQGVSGFSDGKYHDVNDKGEVSEGGASSGQTVYQCNERYFLTDPEMLVLNHLPNEDQKEWQLLARPLTELEFLQMPKYFEAIPDIASKVHLSPHSHPLNVIVAGPGNVDIFLRETGNDEYSYSTELQISAKSINDEAKKAIKDTANVNGYLSKVCRMGNQLMKFKFVPPCCGQFKLKINVTHSWKMAATQMVYTQTAQFAEYVIHCPQAAKKVTPLPQGKLDHFGAGKALQQLGLEAEEEKGELEADDGEQQLMIRRIDANRHQLKCEVEGVDADIDNNRILVWQSQDKNYFIFLAPDSGDYAMVIYDNGKPVCQYLIDAGTEVRDNNMPLPDWSQLQGLGIVNNDLGNSIVPVSHPSPYIVSDGSEMEIKLKVTIDIRIRAEVFFVESESSLTLQENYCFVNGSHEGANVDARFALPGNYVLRMQTQKPDSDEWEPYSNYFVRALGDIDGSTQQFPDQGPEWKQSYRLISPKNRYLPINKDVKMSFKVKDDSVKVAYAVDESNGNKMPLSVQSDGVFSGVIKGGSGSAGSVLKVMAGADDDSCCEILRYEFESDDFKQKQEEQRRRAQEINSKRQEDEERRQRKRENHERKGNGMKELEEDPVAEREREEKKQREKEEERRRKKEEELKKKQEEERLKKEAEEQRLKNEKEQKEKEEAARKKKEEEERKQREEDERLRQEKEAQQRKEEEKRKRDEKEKKRKEKAELEKLNARQKYSRRLELIDEEKKEKREKKRRKREKEVEEMEKQNEEKRRAKKMKKLFKKLEKASTGSDVKAIREALKKVAEQEKGTKKLDYEELVGFAQRLVRALQLKDKLQKENVEAERSKDTEKLQQILNEIEEEKFSEALLMRMKAEMDLANQLLEQQLRSSRQVFHKLDVNSRTLQELCSYNNPPAVVHHAIKGVLLMMGHCEDKTRKWSRCIQPLRQSEKQIKANRTENVHPGIAARAEFLLSAVDQHELQLSSAAAAAFFVWANKYVQQIKSKSKPGSFKPVTGDEQRKILGCTDEEKEDYDFEDGLSKRK